MLAAPVPAVIDHVPLVVAFVKAGVVAFTHTVDAPPDIAVTVGKGFTVAVTADLFADLHWAFTASAYRVVVELMNVGGVTWVPSVAASYQLIVPSLGVAENVTLPEPQTDVGVTYAVVTVGKGFTVAVTADLFADLHWAFTASAYRVVVELMNVGGVTWVPSVAASYQLIVPSLGVAENVTLPEPQTDVGVTYAVVTVGKGFTVAVTADLFADLHWAFTASAYRVVVELMNAGGVTWVPSVAASYQLIVPSLGVAENVTLPEPQTDVGVTYAVVTVGKGFTVAVTADLFADLHWAFTASAYRVVVELMNVGGVTWVPSVAASYQLIVPSLGVAENVTLPEPQTDVGVTYAVVTVGKGFTVAVTADLFADLHWAFTASAYRVVVELMNVGGVTWVPSVAASYQLIVPSLGVAENVTLPEPQTDVGVTYAVVTVGKGFTVAVTADLFADLHWAFTASAYRVVVELMNVGGVTWVPSVAASYQLIVPSLGVAENVTLPEPQTDVGVTYAVVTVGKGFTVAVTADLFADLHWAFTASAYRVVVELMNVGGVTWVPSVAASYQLIVPSLGVAENVTLPEPQTDVGVTYAVVTVGKGFTVAVTADLFADLHWAFTASAYRVVVELMNAGGVTWVPSVAASYQLIVPSLGVAENVTLPEPQTDVGVTYASITVNGIDCMMITLAVAVLTFPLLSVTVKVTSLGLSAISAQVNVVLLKTSDWIPHASPEPSLTASSAIVALPLASSCTVMFLVQSQEV